MQGVERKVDGSWLVVDGRIRSQEPWVISHEKK